MSLLADVEAAQTLNDIMVTIAAVHNLTLLCIHSYHTFPCFTKIKPKAFKILSLLTIIPLFLFPFWVTLIVYHIHYISCNVAINLSVIIYISSKNALYLLFLQRLFGVFKRSAMAFKKIHINLARFIITSYWIGVVIMVSIIGDGKYDRFTNSCKANWPFWFNILGASFDFSACCVISILFSRRLLCLVSMNKKDKDTPVIDIIMSTMKIDPLWDILKKSTILTLIAVFTTSISLLLAAILGLTGMWCTMDAMVNCWCVVLMFKKYNAIYTRCCKCEVFVTIKCLWYYSCSCCFPIGNIAENTAVDQSRNVRDGKHETTSSDSMQQNTEAI